MSDRKKEKEEIRVFLPQPIIKEIDNLVEKGLYGNRSEAIRDIVRDWHKKE